jgi:major type 1 subunit fimbrin (pilin)
MSSRKALTGLALILSGLSSTAAMAADGTVNFNGKIVDTPCIVTAGDDNTAQTVSLGTVKSSSFTAVGITSADVPFNIKLEQCVVGEDGLGATVTFTGSQDGADPTLLAVSGGATGVGIELVNNDNTEIKMGTESAATALQNGNNTLVYKAHYKSTAAAVTTGDANGQAQFQIAYK